MTRPDKRRERDPAIDAELPLDMAIRLEALALAMSPMDIPASYDPEFYLARAARFEAYIRDGLASATKTVVKATTADTAQAPAKPEG